MSSSFSNATQYGTFPSSKPDEASLAVTAVETDNDSTWRGEWLNKCSSAASSSVSTVGGWVRGLLSSDRNLMTYVWPEQLSQHVPGGAGKDWDTAREQTQIIAEASTGTF